MQLPARGAAQADPPSVPGRSGGLVLIGEPVAAERSTGQTVAYARVSCADARPDLDRQVGRITGWATGAHVSVD